MPKRCYLYDKTTGEKHVVNGVKFSNIESSNPELNKEFSSCVSRNNWPLPSKVDLRFSMTPVESQSNFQSCVGNALAGAYEYLIKRATKEDRDVSRLFIYYNARKRDPKSKIIKDRGCSIVMAIEALKESGVCLESFWEYSEDNLNKEPHDRAYQAAEEHIITDAFKLKIDLHEMKECLAKGYPFVFGLILFTSFDEAKKNKGIVPLPHQGDSGREKHRRHAMLAVGYSDKSKAFIVRNSWGNQWGDKGYCYIPYSYMTDPKLCRNPYAVRALNTEDMGREGWEEDDNSDYEYNTDEDSEDDDDEEDDFEFIEEDYDDLDEDEVDDDDESYDEEN